MRLADHRRGVFIAAALCLALGGCTTVTVIDRGGGVSVSRHFLTVALKVEDTGQSHALESHGLGIFASPTVTSVGAYRTELAMLAPEDCRAVFWLTSKDQVEALARLVDLNRVCIAPTLAHPETRP